jgi:hypothetical protein
MVVASGLKSKKEKVLVLEIEMIGQLGAYQLRQRIGGSSAGARVKLVGAVQVILVKGWQMFQPTGQNIYHSIEWRVLWPAGLSSLLRCRFRGAI